MSDKDQTDSTKDTVKEPVKFTHLHAKSHYSLLSALPKIEDLIDACNKYGIKSLALADDGNLYGLIDFYKACTKAKIKPIIAVDMYLALKSRTDMQAGIDNKRHRILLIAENTQGYKNLIKLVTISHMEGFYYKPRIDKEVLEKYKDGLFCIAPALGSDIINALRNKDTKLAEERMLWYKKVFADKFFLEITKHPENPGHEDRMQEIKKMAKKLGIPLMASHEVYYINPEDKVARDTLTQVNSHGDPSDRKTDDDETDYSFIPGEEMIERFRDMPEAIENTNKIAEACNVTIELGKWVFPYFPIPEGKTHDDVLRDLVMEGIKRRGLEFTPEIKERVEYELEVIKKKGYSQYFLVVSDLLHYAHEHGILTNIRGSVAGSLVTYLAHITNVNPLEYKLPFERFLNPERPSAPDIDMDFADSRRDEVISYARDKYGHDKVAQIGTFGTMMARGAVRDVARAMGYPYETGDKISKLIPPGSQGFPMYIDKALEEVAELKALYDKDTDTKRIIDMAKKIEGCVRHISVHAAGVVIAPAPLDEYVPLQFDPKGEKKVITQYDMYAVGEDGIGLLKFDFLGIRNLSILADAVDRVKKIENVDVDIEKIPIDDKKTFEILARGETIGLFQLNGSGMTKFLVDLKPSTIHDINAMVALYRPGPIESIPEYIERKHNPEKIKFLDPRMKDILDRSFGVITYQDDVMMIAIKLAGYSWLEADKLRKAMGKKIPAEMEAQKSKLHDGLIKNGMSEKKSEQLWKLIEPFAAYGFNKAHAASYGRVAYQTAYMKANFPAIYMSAVLSAEAGDVEKIGEVVAECKRMGIPVLAPDVNESFSQFTVVKGKDGDKDRIRFGLVTIKNFGQGASSAIIQERKENGPYTSLANFLDRVRDKNLNKKSLEALIKAGAIDSFGIDRGVLLANLEIMLAYNKEHENGPTNQDSLFGLMEDTSTLPTLKLQEAPPIGAKEKLIWEKELLGLYISGHPLDKYKEIIAKRDMNIAKTKEDIQDGKYVVIAGIINNIKSIITKSGEPMLFINFADFSGEIECVVFPRTFAQFKDKFVLDNCIAIKGKVSDRGGKKSILIEMVKSI